MDPKRREFVRQLGLFIVLLMETRCARPKPRATAQPSSPRSRVRECWMSLDWLAEQGTESGPDASANREPNRTLIATHQAAAAELVAKGELETPVAELVDKAFESAANHVWWSAIKLMCYAPQLPWAFAPESSENLFRQILVLEDLAHRREFDDRTLRKVRASIARDIGFLSLSRTEEAKIMAPFSSNPPPGAAAATFDTAEIDSTPVREAAARFLVDLILEGV